MKALPETVLDAWDNRQPIIVLSTVSKDGVPNSIYVGSVGRYDDSTFFIANKCFNKTMQNILDGNKASILFLTYELKSFQLKGTIELQESGPIYEEMRKLDSGQYQSQYAAVLHVEEAYSGAEKLI
jgi:predicted pyridoxine 5'-phosphate oxidase superfamily flavin-nucleotide-binding protein